MSLGTNRLEEKMMSLTCWHRRNAIGNACSALSPRGELFFREVESEASESKELGKNPSQLGDGASTFPFGKRNQECLPTAITPAFGWNSLWLALFGSGESQKMPAALENVSRHPFWSPQFGE